MTLFQAHVLYSSDELDSVARVVSRNGLEGNGCGLSYDIIKSLLGVTWDFYESFSQSNCMAVQIRTCYMLQLKKLLLSCMINYLIICDKVCRDNTHVPGMDAVIGCNDMYSCM
jgi:hypothetical protein